MTSCLSKTVDRPALAHPPVFTVVQRIAFYTIPIVGGGGRKLHNFTSHRHVECPNHTLKTNSFFAWKRRLDEDRTNDQERKLAYQNNLKTTLSRQTPFN
jgi:hypothetical protein